MNTFLSHLLIATMRIVSEEPFEEQPEFALYHLPDCEFYMNMLNKNEFFIKAHGTYFEVKIVESERAKELNECMKIDKEIDFRKQI